MKRLLSVSVVRVTAIACLGIMLTGLATAATPLVYDMQKGPPTPHEIDGFKAWMREFHPDPNNENDAWAFGHSGQALEALGLLYEATGDADFLNRMVDLAGTALTQRNDLAPGPIGHRALWSGEATPAWGNNPVGGPGASHAGPESGDEAGRIAFCAYLMLRNPALADRTVPDGDPLHLGKTYAERARQFVHLLDATVDGFIVPWFVRKSDHNHYYFPRDHRYEKSLTGPNNAGTPIPWNQQFMFNNALQRLAQCHELLKDDPARVAFYDSCVSASFSWFIEHVEARPDPKAHGSYYLWHYVVDERRHFEDVVHAGLDFEGLYRAYLSGRYQTILTRSRMEAFANDVADVIPLSSNRWAGTVDGESESGHAALTDFPRPNLLVMLEFRPDAFDYFAQATMAAKRTKGDVTSIAHLLWIRWRLSRPAEEMKKMPTGF